MTFRGHELPKNNHGVGLDGASRQENLAFIRDMLCELRKVAEAEGADMLCYLIEMAYIEAGDIIYKSGTSDSGVEDIGNKSSGMSL